MNQRINLIALFIFNVLFIIVQGHNEHEHSNNRPKKHRKGGWKLPDVPFRIKERGNTCSGGSYYENGCKSCTAGYYCTGGTSSRQDCTAGYYSGDGASSCTACPLGTYTDQPRTQYLSNCKDVQPGYKANKALAATAQTACGKGYYSAGKTDKCTICPAGHNCNADTNPSPKPCDPGRYAPTTGLKEDCLWCPEGKFNNIYGATSCCLCCSGWYNGQTSQTHCQNCPGLGSKSQGSPPGATESVQCSFSLTDHKTACDQIRGGDGSCPPTTNKETSSAHSRKRQTKFCPNPLEKRCSVSKARSSAEMRLGSEIGGAGVDPDTGPYECLDIQTNLESCGGCVPVGEIEGPDGGRDCTAIDKAESVACIDGRCVIGSCRPGFKLNNDKSNCIRSHKPARYSHHGIHLDL